MVWFGFDFQELVFPDFGFLASVFAEEPRSTVRFVVSLGYFSDLSGPFLPPKLRGGHRSPLTPGSTFFI
jgi:hypothetical protein